MEHSAYAVPTELLDSGVPLGTDDIFDDSPNFTVPHTRFTYGNSRFPSLESSENKVPYCIRYAADENGFRAVTMNAVMKNRHVDINDVTLLHKIHEGERNEIRSSPSGPLSRVCHGK